MLIKLKTILHCIVIYFCNQLAVTHQLITIHSFAAGNFQQLIWGHAGIFSPATANINAKFFCPGIQSAFQSIHYAGCDSRTMPIHPHDSPKRLKPERVAQTSKNFIRPKVFHQRLCNQCAQNHHSVCQPLRHSSAMKRKICMSTISNHYFDYNISLYFCSLV